MPKNLPFQKNKLFFKNFSFQGIYYGEIQQHILLQQNNWKKKKKHYFKSTFIILKNYVRIF